MKLLLHAFVLLASVLMLNVSCAGSGDSPQAILFLGDSITEEEYYARDIETALNKEAGSPPRIIIRGRNSETISGLSEESYPGDRPFLFTRLDKELRKARPDWVVACYGMNCGLYQPLDETRFAAYKVGVENLILQMHKSGRRLILLTPPPFAKAGLLPEGIDPVMRNRFLSSANAAALKEMEKNPGMFGYKKDFPYYDFVLETYSEWLKTLGEREGVWVIDLRAAMLPRLKECYGADPVHPNRTGHQVMAEAFLNEWPRIKREAYSTADRR